MSAPEKHRVLVVEDDPVCRRALQLALQKRGYSVTLATNGREAWKIFDEDPYRIIVSDWMMPELNGLEFCKKIRGRPDTEYAYFILLTVRTEKKDYLAAMDMGIDDFLTKPLDPEQLTIRLRVAERIIHYATQIHQLKKLLPICTYCKKIRDDKDYWQDVATYLRKNSGNDVSHGVCPKCYESILRPQIQRLKQEAKALKGGAAAK